MSEPGLIPKDPFIVRAGCWLTKRRGVLLTPFFAVALLSARHAENLWLELGQNLLGLACLLGGTWLRLVAASYHEGCHKSVPITAGPYAWVRHPLYLANFLLGFGIVLMAGWWPMTAVYCLFFLPIHAVIARAEEVHLVRLYGREYELYRRAVPAILPWRRFQGLHHGIRNSYKMRKGQEGLKAVGYLAGMAALLTFKQWRQIADLPAIPPLPIPAGIAAFAAAVFAVVYRPNIRWAWLRACQTAIAVSCVLLLAVRIPGVWTSDLGKRAHFSTLFRVPFQFSAK